MARAGAASCRAPWVARVRCGTRHVSRFRPAGLVVGSVNEREIGTLWKPPYIIDVSDAGHAGANKLSIRVINQWTNRLVGDAAAPENERVLGSPILLRGFGGPTPRPLPESGLLGPVVLRLERL
ncbi:MAG: glycosylhydrolase-like jelly roll fold domain-containing protein [Opitutaceae bacterium]